MAQKCSPDLIRLDSLESGLSDQATARHTDQFAKRHQGLMLLSPPLSALKSLTIRETSLVSANAHQLASQLVGPFGLTQASSLVS
jgi:hypothetical protein